MTGRIARTGGVVPLLMAASLLAGCESLGDMLGSGKQPPDEFVVVTKRPLTVPPDFQLRPPEPGKPSPQNIQPAEEVVSALFPNRTDVPPDQSPGELALLANIERGDADVRSTAGDGTQIVDKGLLLPELLSLGRRRMESDGASIEHVSSEVVDSGT